MLAVLDELGVEKVTVAGHDWGGYVGFLLALEHPERVEAPAGAERAPALAGARPEGATLDAWRFLYMPVLSTPGLGGWIGPDARSARDSRSLRARRSPRGSAASAHGRPSGSTATFFLRELPRLVRGRYSAADLRVPTKLVFGQRDVVITTRAVEDAAAQSEMIELELVADATHFVVDEKPELVADRLLGLLPR